MFLMLLFAAYMVALWQSIHIGKEEAMKTAKWATLIFGVPFIVMYAIIGYVATH